MIELLKNKRCFKLVCAAGNEDAQEVEKLVYIYAKAGVKFFDLCAKREILDAAYSGVNKAGFDIKDMNFCVSLGIKGDPHIEKAKVLIDKCKKCFKCLKICPQGAISKYEFPSFNPTKCIGCGICVNNCPNDAIAKYTKEVDARKILSELKDYKIDCIEFHASTSAVIDVLNKWHFINQHYDGTLSICVDRSKFSDTDLIMLLKKMLEDRKPFTTIVQADGIPMSGVSDDYKTTLQAIATAQIVQRANLDAYLMLSGGTNSKTAELANMFELNYHGIAVGSYARMIVKEHIYDDEFWQNESIQADAIQNALNLVKKLV